MLDMLLAFLPVAALLTITPGVATALVVHHAVRDGRRSALAVIAGNEAGVVVWGLIAAVGLAAVVATSVLAFTIVKYAGAVALVVLGARALLRSRAGHEREAGDGRGRGAGRDRSAFTAGLATAMTNPKLAAFYVALFPQFVPDGASVLAASLLMAALLIVLDVLWYSALATVVVRARSFGALRWAERVCGAVMIGLGVRLALERPAVR